MIFALTLVWMIIAVAGDIVYLRRVVRASIDLRYYGRFPNPQIRNY